MTKQELFDIVTKHLLTQMRKSKAMIKSQAFSDDERCFIHGPFVNACAYRGEHSCKCAIGVVITDEDYRFDFEGVNILSLIVEHSEGNPSLQALKPFAVVEEGPFNLFRRSFITKLQLVHDAFEPGEWFLELQSMAKDEGLAFNPPAPVSK
jgi:hypothetical protein